MYERRIIKFVYDRERKIVMGEVGERKTASEKEVAFKMFSCCCCLYPITMGSKMTTLCHQQ